MFVSRAFITTCFCLSVACVSSMHADPTYNIQSFATGAAVGSTAPDSVSYGNGSLWVAYTNGADSAGASGASTVVRYSPAGAVLNSWSIAGNVDGLKVDPNTGNVWALQNNDGNSALTVINPVTNAATAYVYGSSYTNVANRGFDDVAFTKGNIYLSQTNPASGTDPVVFKLTSGLSSSGLQVSPVLTSTFSGINLATGAIGSTTISDSDSLTVTPSGALALTGEADKQIAYIKNPGASNQQVNYVSLLGTDGMTIKGKPDDTLYPNATGGFFYFADTGANTVYRVTATNLNPGSVYVDVGNEFGILDTTTGIVTPIFTGVSPHGADFVSLDAAGVPEPGTLGLALGGVLLCGGLLRRRA